MPNNDHQVLRTPFKRGKVLPEKRKLSQQGWPEKASSSKPSSNDSTDPKQKEQASWSSTLTPGQRESWARLLHQRHSPMLDLDQLPEDLLFRITGFLDASTLLKMRGLNRRYSQLCARDGAGWDRLCRKLWENKVHIPTFQLSGPGSHSDVMMNAYRKSIQDARDRQSITPEEMCYDPETHKGTVWSFRFKVSAGSDWTSADPWFNGEPCRRMVFLHDGTVKQYITGGTDPLQSPRFGTSVGGAAARTDAALPVDDDVVVPEEEVLELQRHQHVDNSILVVNNPVSMTWRFISRPMDLPNRPNGGYVRITVGGRDVPTYSVRRSPTGNWGFVMESCWGLFASFELPPRIIPRQVRLRRTAAPRNPNGWVDILLEESDSSDESEDGTIGAVSSSEEEPSSEYPREVDPFRVLRDDSCMVITNEIQWREAFLYNVGARILPDGEEATDEFDRAWGGV